MSAETVRIAELEAEITRMRLALAAAQGDWPTYWDLYLDPATLA